MKKITTIISCILLFNCSIDRTISPITSSENVILERFQKLDKSNKSFISNENEPGENLLLCLTFIDKISKKPLSNHQASFYHTSTDGEYQPSNPNDETTARLNGTAKTNKFGEIYIETILPGNYGNSPNNRHIHTTFYKFKPKNYDIFFKQYSEAFGNFMNSGKDQLLLADLKKTRDNKLVCFMTIEVKK